MYRYLCFFLLLCLTSKAQQPDELSYYQELRIGLSPFYSSFQDQKFSNTINRGVGLELNTAYLLNRKGKWKAEGCVSFGSLKASTHQQAKYRLNKFSLNFSYIHPLKYNDGASWFVGVSWSPMSYLNLLEKNNLGNSAVTFVAGSNFNLNLQHLYITASNRLLCIDVQFQLFSFMKELPGFAAPYPQEQAENGDFNYDNEGPILPFALRTYYYAGYWSFLNLQTRTSYELNSKWTACYNWQLMQSYKVESYRLTYAQHSLSIQYSF